MCLSTWATLVTAGVMLAACATAGLTPRQEAGLREAQEIADRTTDAYRVSRVKVFAVPLLRSAGVYRPRSDWIMMHSPANRHPVKRFPRMVPSIEKK